MIISWGFTELYQCVERLSWSSEKQVEYLRNLGLLPLVDELALEFDDVVGLVPQYVNEGRLSNVQADSIYRLDDLLNTMSGKDNAHLWTEEALVNNELWNTVREHAKHALKLLDSE